MERGPRIERGPSDDDLTPREEEVVDALVETSGDRPVIARRLGLRMNTLNSHLQHIREKLGAHNDVGILVALGRVVRR